MSPFEAIKRHAKEKPLVYVILVFGIIALLTGLTLDDDWGTRPPDPKPYTISLSPGEKVPLELLEHNWFRTVQYTYTGLDGDTTALAFKNGDSTLVLSDARAGTRFYLPRIDDANRVDIDAIDELTGELTLRVEPAE